MIVSDTLRDNLPLADTVVALGFFDGIHRGHTRVIGGAVEYGVAHGLTPCVFTFSAPQGDSPKPAGELIQTETVKRYLLEQMGVDYVFCPAFEEFRGLTPEEFVQDVLVGRFRARMVFCGENFHFGRNAAGTVETLTVLGRQYGLEVTALPLERENGEVISSTAIRRALKAGEIELADRMLGHPFTLIAPVVHGRELGRQWNYPTANQNFPPEQIIPRNGVYATVAVVDGRRYAGSTNVGSKPTVDGGSVLSETFLVGYDGDLYGRELVVEFHHFIRGEKKFDSIAELRRAIAENTETALQLCEKYL
ncbi:MAG: riboflavin biosynthesis protein RibF [Clostridiales bacterium]|nr:riboflavin biosynthesis protein RibF [Clostridiales bacterium]